MLLVGIGSSYRLHLDFDFNASYRLGIGMPFGFFRRSESRAASLAERLPLRSCSFHEGDVSQTDELGANCLAEEPIEDPSEGCLIGGAGSASYGLGLRVSLSWNTLRAAA